jgi:hypothetical protein
MRSLSAVACLGQETAIAMIVQNDDVQFPLRGHRAGMLAMNLQPTYPNEHAGNNAEAHSVSLMPARTYEQPCEAIPIRIRESPKENGIYWR